MFNSLKGRPVQGFIFQGKEPPQFNAIFQPMVVLKGGMSSGYKTYIVDKGLNDETYTADCVALIRISGTSVHNNKAVQVDAASSFPSGGTSELMRFLVEEKLEAGQGKTTVRRFFSRFCTPIFLESFILTFLAEWGDEEIV